MGPVDQVALVACLGFSLLALRVRPAWGLFALATLLPPLCSGSTVSGVRFVAVVFPAFVAAARLLRSEASLVAACVGMALLQGLLFAAFAAFRWVA